MQIASMCKKSGYIECTAQKYSIDKCTFNQNKVHLSIEYNEFYKIIKKLLLLYTYVCMCISLVKILLSNTSI